MTITIVLESGKEFTITDRTGELADERKADEFKKIILDKKDSYMNIIHHKGHKIWIKKSAIGAIEVTGG